MNGNEVRRSFPWRRSVGLGLVAVVGVISIGTTAGASAKSFRTAADKVCTENGRQFVEYTTDNGPPQDPEGERVRVEALLPGERDALEQLQGLKPPKKLRSKYEDYLDTREREIENDEAFLEAAAANDTDATDSLGAKVNKILAEQWALGAKLGFFACAEGMTRAEEEKAQAIVEETFVNNDPAFCTEKYTENYIEFFSGGLENCVAAESPKGPAETTSIEITFVGGIDKVRATVGLVVGGGPDDGQPLEVDLVYDDGIYKREGIYAAG